MRFWQVQEPPGSDYRHVQVSGRLEHPYRMPAVRCEACGEHLNPWNEVVPFTCPPEFQAERWLTDPDAEVSMRQFRELEKKLVTAWRQAGVRKPAVRPGACLQPAFLDVPSVPKFDFLWSNLWSGLSSIVVGERMRELLVDLAADAVTLVPVVLRKVGRRSAQSTPRVPKGGEPEDMMARYPAGGREGVGPYYQLLIAAQSGYVPGTEPGPACEVCGEETGPDWKSEDSESARRWRSRDEVWRSLSAAQVASVWTGAPIFRLAGRGTVLVTEVLKERIETMGATNVAFREFPIPVAAPVKRRRTGPVSTRARRARQVPKRGKG